MIDSIYILSYNHTSFFYFFQANMMEKGPISTLPIFQDAPTTPPMERISRRDFLQGIGAIGLTSILYACGDYDRSSYPPEPPAAITSSRAPREFVDLPPGTPVRLFWKGGASYGTPAHFGASLELDTTNLPVNSGALADLSWIEGGNPKKITIFLPQDGPLKRVFPPFVSDTGTPIILEIRSLSKSEPIVYRMQVSDLNTVFLASCGQKPVLSGQFKAGGPMIDPQRPWRNPGPGTDVRLWVVGGSLDPTGIISGLQLWIDAMAGLKQSDNPLILAEITWTDPKGNPGSMQVEFGTDWLAALPPFQPNASGFSVQFTNVLTGTVMVPATPLSGAGGQVFGYVY